MSGRCLDAAGFCSGCRGGAVMKSSHMPTRLQPARQPFSFDGSTSQHALTRNTLVPCICRSQVLSSRPTLDIGWIEECPLGDCSSGSCGCIPYLWEYTAPPGRNPGTIGNELVEQKDCSPQVEEKLPDTRRKSYSCHSPYSLEKPNSCYTTNYGSFCASALDTSRTNLCCFEHTCIDPASLLLLT